MFHVPLLCVPLPACSLLNCDIFRLIFEYDNKLGNLPKISALWLWTYETAIFIKQAFKLVEKDCTLLFTYSQPEAKTKYLDIHTQLKTLLKSVGLQTYIDQSVTAVECHIYRSVDDVIKLGTCFNICLGLPTLRGYRTKSHQGKITVNYEMGVSKL